MQAPPVRCPNCRSPSVVITLSDRARAACSACGTRWIQQGWHPSLGSLGRALPEGGDPGRRSAVLAASGVSPFELGLGIVRRLVEERNATVLDYDVTPDGGVVNLRVQAPLGTRAAWIRSRSSVLLKAADVLQVRTEVARASLTRTLAERSRLLLEVRAHRSALRESRVRLGEETSRLKHSYGRARDLVGAGASLGRPGEPSAA